MILPEAIAVYLYLQNSEELAWNQAVYNEAWGVITAEAERVINARIRIETINP